MRFHAVAPLIFWIWIALPVPLAAQSPESAPLPAQEAKGKDSGQGAQARSSLAGKAGGMDGRDANSQAKPADVEISRGLRPLNEDKGASSGEPIDTSRAPSGAARDEARGRRSFAVCIGINHYLPESGFSELQYAAADASSMAKAFLTQAKFNNVLLMTDGPVDPVLQSPQYKSSLSIVADVKRSSLYDQTRRFFMKANCRDDVLVFYFAGHGHSTTQAFLVPGDYNKDDPDPLALSELFNLINGDRVYAANKLMILDACRSAVNDSKGRVMVRSFRDAMVQPDKQLAILTGCTSEQSSKEDATLQHGRFTWSLLDAFTNGFRPGEEYLFVSHIFEHVEKRFKEHKWDAGQAPQQFSSGSSIAVAYHPIPKPEALGQFEWEYLRRDHEEAKKRYRAGELERASQAYRYALRATTDEAVLKNQDARQIHGRLLLERAIVLYRLGRKDEAKEHRTEASKYRSESPELYELEAYELADAGQTAEALARLEIAVDRTGDSALVNDYLWSRKAALEVTLGRYGAAALSYNHAAVAAHKAGNRREAKRYFDDMRRIDFSRAWLDFARQTRQPAVGIKAIQASYDCAREIFGDEHWRTREVKALFDAITRESKLPWPRLQTILELETIYSRLDASERSADALSIVQLLSENESEVQGPRHGYLLANGQLLSAHQAGMHGPASPWAANSFSIIGRRLTKLNRPAEAAESFQRALHAYQAYYGLQHPNTVRTQLRLSAALKAAGKTAEAAEMLKAAHGGLEYLVRALSEDDDADSSWDIGNMLYYAGSYQQAIPFLESAATGYDAVQKPQDAAWMQGWIGSCFREMKQDDQAAKAYELSANRFRELKNDEGIAIESSNFGKALYRLKRYQEAIGQFEVAAGAYNGLSRVSDAAWMNDSIGDALRKLQRSREALPYYDLALAAFQKLGNQEDITEVLYERADSFYDAADYEKALPLFDVALKASEAAGLPIKAAWSQSMEGLCLKKLGRDSEALAKYLECLDRFGKIQHKEDIASLHIQVAQALKRLKRDNEALVYFESGAKLDADFARPSYVAWDYIQLAGCLQNLNRAADARATYQKAVDSLQAQPSLDGMGQNVWGQALYNLARYEEALVHFERAVPAYEKEEQLAAAARMYEWRGDCYRDLKRYAEAALAYGEGIRRLDGMQQEDVSYLRKEYAKSLYRAKRQADAVPQFELAIKACEKANLPIDATWMVAWLGDCYVDLKRDEDAAKNYQECLDRFAKLDHKQDMTHVYRDLGDTLRRLNRYDAAIAQFQTAADRYAKEQNPHQVAWMQDRIAGCYRDRKDYAKAKEIFEATLATFMRLGNKAGIAEENTDLGQTFYREERFAEALPYFRTAAAAYEEAKDPATAAYQYGWIGDCYRRSGDDVSAVAAYNECAQRFISLKHDEGLALNTSNLADALVRLKRLDEALPHYQISADAYLRLKQPANAETAFSSSARALYDAKRYEEALPIFAAARKAAEDAKLPIETGWMECWRGLCFRDLKRDEDAIVSFQFCLKYFQDLKHESDAFNAKELGEALARLQRHEEAVKAFTIAVESFRRQKLPADIAKTLFGQSKSLVALKQHEQAIATYEAAAASYAESKDPASAAWMISRIGDCYVALNKDQNAAASFRDALDRFTTLKVENGIAVSASDLGKVLKRQGKIEEAIPLFASASQIYEKLQQPLDRAWMQDWLAGCYRDLKHDEPAVAAYRVALALVTQENDAGGIGEEGDDLGQALSRLKRYDEAVAPFQAAIAAYEKLNRKEDAVGVRLNLGKAYRDANQWELALAQYDLALTWLAEQPTPRRSATVGDELGQALLQAGRRADARRYLTAAEQIYRKLGDIAKADQIKRQLADLPAP